MRPLALLPLLLIVVVVQANVSRKGAAIRRARGRGLRWTKIYSGQFVSRPPSTDAVVDGSTLLTDSDEDGGYMGDMELEEGASRVQYSGVCSNPAECTEVAAHGREDPSLVTVGEAGRDGEGRSEEGRLAESEESSLSRRQSEPPPLHAPAVHRHQVGWDPENQRGHVSLDEADSSDDDWNLN